jgi:hypothetical protein
MNCMLGLYVVYGLVQVNLKTVDKSCQSGFLTNYRHAPLCFTSKEGDFISSMQICLAFHFHSFFLKQGKQITINA